MPYFTSEEEAITSACGLKENPTSYFMSEGDAMDLINKNMDKIEARMASGTSGVSQANAGNAGVGGSKPCDGDCAQENCCNCCVCA
jgi:hypothetical protein